MRPTIRALASAIWLIGQLLDVDHADYCFEGRFSFALADEWSLVISADDAGRFRLDACHRSRVRATIWCLAEDRARLTDLVLGIRQEAAALAA